MKMILSSCGILTSFPAALQADGQEVASVVSAQEIRVVAELLQISPEGLQKAITYKVTVSIKSNQFHLLYIVQYRKSQICLTGLYILNNTTVSVWTYI